ncbi:hypothetical protein O6H91_01G142700 [Diphasiastrum complanatum]|uniref:Uncharacterized protein n=1 Tax=Diphasiastrum complanatum TaxID=34168 RepID=A0ACC2EX03_DIPCM|nr:hypothetical protein O6H91_01G142700 [Diphasiastrum complanatum]
MMGLTSSNATIICLFLLCGLLEECLKASALKTQPVTFYSNHQKTADFCISKICCRRKASSRLLHFQNFDKILRKMETINSHATVSGTYRPLRNALCYAYTSLLVHTWQEQNNKLDIPAGISNVFFSGRPDSKNVFPPSSCTHAASMLAFMFVTLMPGFMICCLNCPKKGQYACIQTNSRTDLRKVFHSWIFKNLKTALTS